MGESTFIVYFGLLPPWNACSWHFPSHHKQIRTLGSSTGLIQSSIAKVEEHTDVDWSPKRYRSVFRDYDEDSPTLLH